MSVRKPHVSMIRQAGLSIVEVMIALTIGTILTVGVVQLFVANSETYSMLVGQSRVQENARFAIEFISRSVRMAGYKGCYSVNSRVSTTLDPPTNVPYEYDIRENVLGYEGVGDGLWLPAISDLPETAGGTDTSFVAGNGVPTDTIKTGTAAADQTDVLVIRKISNSPLALATDMLTSADDVIVTKPAAGLDFGCNGCTPNRAWDDLALIYDCEKSTIFRVTQIDDGPGAGEATIKHGIAEVDATRNNQTQLAEVNTFEAGDSGVAAIVTDIFYVAPGTGVNNVGDAPFALWRKSGVSKPVELVEGIEDLQVEYGVDTDNDGIPNQYVKASGIANSRDVLTVRVEVIANSVDDVGSSQTDGLMRRTFSQTMQIRNKG